MAPNAALSAAKGCVRRSASAPAIAIASAKDRPRDERSSRRSTSAIASASTAPATRASARHALAGDASAGSFHHARIGSSKTPTA